MPPDHHVHLLSPALVRDWKSLGVPFSKADTAYTSVAHTLSVLGAGSPGDTAAFRAVLLPMAHLYGQADFRQALGLTEAEEYARVRHENDYVARQAAAFPGRVAAFCGVDILRPYAWTEIRRCRGQLESAGMKIHLASAGVDLRDDAHLDRLARLTGWAASGQVPLLLHFDPQDRGLEAADVRRFINRVLQPQPQLTVVIAHLGGSGGYGGWTRTVYRTFSEWLAAEVAAGRPRAGYYFDLSAVLLEEETEGVPASSRADREALGRDLARTGLQRILFGSDYPVFDPRSYARLLLRAGAVDSAGWQSIARNRLPLSAGTAHSKGGKLTAGTNAAGASIH